MAECKQKVRAAMWVGQCQYNALWYGLCYFHDKLRDGLLTVEARNDVKV